MRKTIFFYIISIFCFSAIASNAQLTEAFSDGNLNISPPWTGTVDSWIVNANGKLQSNSTDPNSTFYLSTANSLSAACEWEFSARVAFNPSSANYVDVYLTATSANLTATATSGYFVRLGNTNDEICLYRKNTDGTITKLIDGVDGILNTTNNSAKIKVTCTANYQWSLFRDISSAANNYIAEGTVTDSAITGSAYFGFLIKQSSSSFFRKHFFDDISIKSIVTDTSAPNIESVTAVTNTQIDVTFSEAVDIVSAEAVNNYSVNNGIGNPLVAARDQTNYSIVHLRFANALANGTANTLTINNVKDVSGNSITNKSSVFSFYIAKRFDVVIDEILADPSPVLALPEAEFIEVKNTTEFNVELAGWQLKTSTSSSTRFPGYTLQPDSFIIITSSANVHLFSAFKNVIGIGSFPALNNTGTTLTLVSKEGATIHSVSYNSSWFKDEAKSAGGWTLEMIDTDNPCSGENNWKASVNASGGTPGTRNSVDGVNPDREPPALVKAAAIDSVTISMNFSEPVDSALAATISNYIFTENIKPVAAVAVAPEFSKVRLSLSEPISKGEVYNVTVNNVHDCAGNLIQPNSSGDFGLSDAVVANDVVINEVLFNPKPSGVDYVELYNRTNKLLNLKDLFVTNRSLSTGALGTLRRITTEDVLLLPADYFVITENSSLVRKNYFVKKPLNFIDITMPSLPNEEGIIVLIDSEQNIIDEFRYSSKWHLAVLDNPEGVALERINYNKATQDKANWASAASTVGFGTPSYKNSQTGSGNQTTAEISISPKTFSPDGDGYEDIATINYQVTVPGHIANITIFDAHGRLVKSLAKNATLALSGSFKWDGLDDKLNKVAVGAYVVFTEVFNLNGTKKSFKNAVIVSRKF